MTDPNQATRTCTVCGQKKPLVAFLELAGEHGHAYGNICATCRGAGLGRKTTKEADISDNSGGTTRFQLDNKMRIQAEHEKQDQLKHQTELDQDEKAKKEHLALEDSTETEEHEKIEKKHREEYLQEKSGKPEKQKATSFLDRQKLGSHAFTQEKKWGEKEQLLTASENLQEGNKAEARKTAADVSTISIDEQTASVGRSAGSTFDQFRKFLGKSAAINRTLEQYGQKSEQQSSSLFAKDAHKETKEAAAVVEKKETASVAKRPPSFLSTRETVGATAGAEENIVTSFVNQNVLRRK